jgi:hypothetical protein
VGRAFQLAPVADGARYEGPHGPMTMPADQAPDASRIVTSDGEAHLAWGRLSRDERALDAGVPLRIGPRELTLRRDGRELVAQDAAGAPLAVARRRRFGRVEVTRSDGTPVAAFRAMSGQIEDAATADEVALVLLLVASGAAGELERRVPLFPF